MPNIKQQSLLTLGSLSKAPVELVYREWYFAFCKSQLSLPFWQRWAMRLSPKHMTHCYAFTQVGKFVLFVEPHRDRVEFTVNYPNKESPITCAETMAEELGLHGHVVVRHKYIPSIRGVKSIFNCLPTCVSVVKCATGYASFSCLPSSLLKDLLKNGAKVVTRGALNG